MRPCLIDTGVFLCLAFEDPGYRECGELLDQAHQGRIGVVMSSLQLAELLTPFLRAGDAQGSGAIKEAVAALKPRMRDVDGEIACRAAELRSSIRTPAGSWLALADSLILSTALTERVEVLYTTDIHFMQARGVRVMAPQMGIEDWVKRYGTAGQRKALDLA